MSNAPIPRSLLPDSAELHSTDVVIGGVSLTALAESYGTPLFVYDEETIRSRCREAVAVFDSAAFASKSFLCVAMAKLVVEEGLLIDVATEGEFDIVRRAGVPPDRIVVHGNNKSSTEISRAINERVHRLVVDNFDEIDRVASLANASLPIDCLVRVTPGIEAHTHEFVKTGHDDTKFGFPISTGEAALAIDRLVSTRGVRVVGVHSHIGSQIFDVDPFNAEVEVLGQFVGEREPEEVCIGGGLGVAYVEGEAAPSITEWGRAARAAAERFLPAGVQLTAEPGRAIVAQAAVTVYRVGALKPGTARTYLAVNGGMSDNPRPVLYGSGYESFALSRPLATRDGRFRIVGKHCESGDVLIDEASLPHDVRVDELIVTPVTGAYGYSMASNYNRVPRPAVVFVRDGIARVVLRRESLDDLASLEV